MTNTKLQESDPEQRIFDYRVGNSVVTGKLNAAFNYVRVPVYLLGMAIADAVFPRNNSFDEERNR